MTSRSKAGRQAAHRAAVARSARHASHPAVAPLQVAAAVALAFGMPLAHAQEAQQVAAIDTEAAVLGTVKVSASADASATGLTKTLSGGQVARGGRVGILGTRDQMETPFSVTSYTSQLIQDQQAQSVADVLQNDPSIRMARGFGNFQETYFVRGFLLYSDDIAYNGLFGLLPRQYIASDLFERVEVLRGASAFLTGATPSGTGIGGTINLLPKRAPNDPLTRVDLGLVNSKQFNASADVARRFGPDESTGLRLVATHRQGDTAIDREHNKEDLISAGLDWHNADTRLSADLGYQNHHLEATRTNVTLDANTVTAVPSAPKSTINWAQPWSYSKEKDTFGSLRGEHDFTQNLTGWAALGARQTKEDNSLANLTVTANDGTGSVYRFDNARKERVITGEVGLRGKFSTGEVKHEVVGSLGAYEQRRKNGYTFDYGNQLATSLYNPVFYDQPAWTAGASTGNSLSDPRLTNKIQLRSLALGDTMSFMDERLLVTLGARYQTLKIDDYAYDTGALQSHYDDSRTSPMAGVVYRLQDNLSLYANYIEGLAQGETAPLALDGRTLTNAGQSLSPYVSKQKEIGIKYDAGGTIYAATLFSTDKPRGMIDANYTFVSSGKDRHQGLELTVQGEPVKHLRAVGGITLLDAKQRSTGSALTDGKRVLGVPKQQLSLALDWDTPWVEGLSLDARVVNTGAVKADSANTLEAPGWTRLDIGARYLLDVQGQLVTLRARVDNLADRKYWSSAGGYPNSGYLVQGQPRTFSLSASIDF